jgi:hypothetical protein
MAGSQLLVNVLLDETDDWPLWLQAWSGMNTIETTHIWPNKALRLSVRWIRTTSNYWPTWQDINFADQRKQVDHWSLYRRAEFSAGGCNVRKPQ